MSFISTYGSASIKGWQDTNVNNLSYTRVQTLTPGNVAVGGSYRFGADVSISADANYLAVGATEFITGYASGQVYMYTRDSGLNTYSLQQNITPNSYPGGDWWFFGDSVDINENGNTLVVGAPNYDTNVSPNEPGAAYVFTRSGNTWTEQAFLQGSANTTFFGRQVQIDATGTLIAINANSANSQGTTYIYSGSGNTWTNTQQIAGSRTLGRSGFALSADGNYLALGADGNAQVQIYANVSNTFTFQQQVSHPAPAPQFSNFGRSVSLNEFGNILVVGASADGSPNVAPGKTFVYSRSGNTWSLSTELSANFLLDEEGFGSRVDCNANGDIIFSTRYDNGTTGINAITAFAKVPDADSYQQFQNVNYSNLRFTTTTCNDSGSIIAGGAQQSVANYPYGSVSIFTSYG